MVTPAAGLLDTSVVVSLPELADDPRLPQILHISTITLAELSVGPLVAVDDDERLARQALLQQAEADFTPLPFDAAAARSFARVAAALRSNGAKRRARAFDALIAATALSRNLPLVTRNARDVQGIPELEIIDLG